MKTRACAVITSFVASLALSQDGETDAPDFSTTNSVTIRLADAPRGRRVLGRGLEHDFFQSDGRTTVVDVEGVPCRSLNLSDEGYNKGYLYFVIDPTFKAHDISKVRIDVEYFDGFPGKEGVFGLQYDTARPAERTGFASTQLLPNVPLKGSGKWLRAAFHVRDATFQSSGNGRADFRLWASPPELRVSRVTVTLEPELPPQASKPLAFDAAGEAKLQEWNVQWDSGSKPTFFRRNEPDGSRWLEIQAHGEPVGASWRTCPLLEAGTYQFVGRARTIGDGANVTVALRASGRGAAQRVNATPDGTALSYEFTMPAPGYVELVCELLGSEGTARFHLDSLKAVRKHK